MGARRRRLTPTIQHSGGGATRGGSDRPFHVRRADPARRVDECGRHLLRAAGLVRAERVVHADVFARSCEVPRAAAFYRNIGDRYCQRADALQKSISSFEYTCFDDGYVRYVDRV